MRKLQILAIAFLLLPATAMAATAPTTITIDVVSARSLGCSPDTFTAPDLRVTVFVNGQQLLQTLEANDNAAPEYGAVGTISVRLPATIGIEVQEAEPGGFFGLGESWLQCSVGPSGAQRADFTYDGNGALRIDTQGDDSKAAEAVVVVGTDAPSQATPTASAIGIQSAHLSWPVDARAVGDRVMNARVGGQIANVGLAGAYDWTGLCDNTQYTYRIMTDDAPWHVSSADGSFTTLNAAPDPARMLEAWVNDKNVTIRWEWGAHDAARFDVLTGPDAASATRNATSFTVFAPSPFKQASTSFARVSGDNVVRVRLVDSGGLTSLSDAFTIGDANRTATFPSMADSCGSGTQSSGGTASPPPAAPQPSASPTPTPSYPPAMPPPRMIGENDSDEFSFAMEQEILLAPGARFAPVNLSFSNTNELRAQQIDLRATLDESFTQQPTPPAIVFPRQVRNESLAFNVRTDAAPGRHMVRIDAVNHNTTHTLFANITIISPPASPSPPAFETRKVLAVYGSPAEFPIAPGSDARVRVSVSNVDNETVTARLVALWFVDSAAPEWNGTRSAGWSSEYEAADSLLPPGASMTRVVTIHAPQDAPMGQHVTLVMFALYNSTPNTDILGGSGYENMTVESTAAIAASGGFHVSSAGWAAIGGAGVGGAALGLGLLLRREKWRLLLLGPFMALYTRLAAPQLLHHESRDALHKLILQRPGIRYAELKRETGLPTGALVHHLRALERGRLIAGRTDASQKRYYPPGAASVTLTPVTGAQQRVLDLLADGPLSQAELATRLGVSQQAANAHVKALERAGLVMIERSSSGTIVHKVVQVSVVERA